MQINSLNLKETVEEIQLQINNMFDKMYPVGSIYLSVNNVNPSTLFGGTWQSWGSGRVPVGVNSNNTKFNTVEKTGGEETHIITTSEMPSHTHTFTGSSHTHTIPAHAHGLNSHTHSVKEHTHSFSGTTGSTGVTVQGILSYPNALSGNQANEGKVLGGALGNAWANNATFTFGSATGHTHTYSGTTGKLAAFNTGAATGNTANSSQLTSGGTTQGGTNSNTGSGTAHNNLQPYITCYMWKRVA